MIIMLNITIEIEITEEFNDCFSKIGVKLASNICKYPDKRFEIKRTH